MRFVAVLAAVLAVAASAVPAFAGSPHFVDDSVSASVSGSTLTVTGKEAGLGDEAQVHVVVTATANCVNPGGNQPSAANKESVTAAGDFPVQNGRADFSLSATAVFQPPCSPPMSVAFTDVQVCDTTNAICTSL